MWYINMHVMVSNHHVHIRLVIMVPFQVSWTEEQTRVWVQDLITWSLFITDDIIYFWWIELKTSTEGSIQY